MPGVPPPTTAASRGVARSANPRELRAWEGEVPLLWGGPHHLLEVLGRQLLVFYTELEDVQQRLVVTRSRLHVQVHGQHEAELGHALEQRVDEHNRPRNPFDSLTARERTVSDLVANGLRNREIARELGITEGTVKVYLHRIYEKLDVSSRTELALAVRDRLHQHRR